MGKLKAFQLLEINIISAQDLEPVSKKMKTYATAWMHSHRKLSSCIDTEGNNNPTWNDKFVFRVDEDFLRQDTSAVMIEIHSSHWLRDVLVGTVRVLVGNLIPPPSLARGHQGQMRFVALQVRRPSGRPQGILNIGVALLDSSMKSMPLYRQLSMSAVGFRDLMDGSMNFQQNENPNGSQVSTMKPILRRSKSERSELVALDNNNISPSSSVVPIKIKPRVKDGSIISITEGVNPFIGVPRNKVGKASSVISGAELRDKPKKGGKKGGGSVLSDSIFSKESSSFRKMAEVDPVKPATTKKSTTTSDEKPKPAVINKSSPPNNKNENNKMIVVAPPPPPRYNKKGNNKSSVWSDSEVGPSPSEVAAAMMAERKYPLEDNQSSVLDGWSVDESVEGLRSKLERWRTELPPLYDQTGFSSSSYTKSSVTGTGGGGRRHARRHSDTSSAGLFSCFGNFFGYECQCICGKPSSSDGRRDGKRSRSATFQSPSTLTPGRSYM